MATKATTLRKLYKCNTIKLYPLRYRPQKGFLKVCAFAELWLNVFSCKHIQLSLQKLLCFLENLDSSDKNPIMRLTCGVEETDGILNT